MDSTTVSRLGNLQRAEWRQRCRQVLSDHLKDRLGLVVEPTQVRLIPDSGDEYMWVPVSEREHLFKEHLFKKQLSKHSIGAYMELCREVGISFEAAAQPGLDSEGMIDTPKDPEPGVNIISRIKDLQAQNFSLTTEFSHWKEQAQENLAVRQRAEEELTQLQRQLKAAQIHIEQLQKQNVKLSSRVRWLKKRMSQYNLGLKKIVSVSQRLDSDRSIYSDEEEDGNGFGSLEHSLAIEVSG